jgi:ATP-binding cassette subfamily F protein uup
LTGTLPLDGKVVVEKLKLGYYTQSGINPKPGQRGDVVKEYGEFIPLMRKMISASNY